MASTLTVQGNGGGVPAYEPILVDALPYIDDEYNEPGRKQMVNRLIQQVCKGTI